MTSSLSRRAALVAAALVASLAVAAVGASSTGSNDLVQSQGKGGISKGASWH